MQVTFLDAAGVVLFARDDMEQGNWTEEEYTVNATFPFVADKKIERGQRMCFPDPATGTLEFFEVRNVTITEPEHYQQIIAESIVITELSAEHIDTKEITGKTAPQALASVLSGTLWAVGNVNLGSAEERAEIQADIAALGLNGNVDLTNRPIISPATMHAAGYTDFDGDYATLYSMTYTETTMDGVACTVLFTPIRVNGTVLSQDQIDAYVDGICAASANVGAIKAADSQGLLIHALQGEHIAQMDAIAEQAHDLSDEWEQLTTGGVENVDITRGSVWQAVGAIATNWNVYITPRVTINAAGSITGKYLDISDSTGVWRGVRLSIDKNMSDATVTYDDTEVVTAMYGYGGSVDVPQTQGDDKQEELTFSDVVWTATADHPAKPAGQKYLNDPAKTALYGINGRPRYGFYQNADITDPEILLDKTWESLQASSTPKINISGTTADLRRLGYHDEPLRLHDMVIVDIPETGESFYLQIIRLDLDLIDPTACRPEIGQYIPNIIYINRETSTQSGGGGGGGRGKGSETNQYNTYSALEKNTNELGSYIGMVVGKRNGKEYIKAGEIVISINDDGGTTAKIHADTIDMQGVVEALEAYDISCGNLTTGVVTCQTLNAESSAWAEALYVGGGSDPSITIANSTVSSPWVECTTLEVGGDEASWQTYAARFPTLGTRRYFLYSAASGDLNPSGTARHYPITSYTDVTLHYLGKAST